MRNVADTGLNILFQLLQNVSNNPEAAQSFYQTYYTDILQHMFSVVTDTSHTAGLTMHATILAYMFALVETNKVTISLNPSAPQAGNSTNIAFVQDFITNLLQTSFFVHPQNFLSSFFYGPPLKKRMCVRLIHSIIF